MQLESDADLVFQMYPHQVSLISEFPETAVYLRSLKISRIYIGEDNMSFKLHKPLAYTASIVVARKDIDSEGMEDEHLRLSERVFRLKTW